ncbi:MAG: hypothetical protein HQM12_15060 [SAR324 cluster bacterium]|nr:hypothetical protein [SAR324 cluster bacterium]
MTALSDYKSKLTFSHLKNSIEYRIAERLSICKKKWFALRLKKTIQKKISLVGNKNPIRFSSEDLKDNFFFLSTFITATADRMKILEATIPQSFIEIGNSNLTVRVIDASDKNWSGKIESVFEKIHGINLQYKNQKIQFAPSIYNTLQQCSEKYFCLVYDDQPIFGLNTSFLKASCQLLKDYEGSLDMVLMETLKDYRIENDKIYFNLSDLGCKQYSHKLIEEVSYNGHKFGIYENYQYGFFFNTIIASCKDYSKRLEWYLKNIGENGQHIELAGKAAKGPIFHHIAVSHEVFMMDIGYEHTTLSIRGNKASRKDLYQALKKGYGIQIT